MDDSVITTILHPETPTWLRTEESDRFQAEANLEDVRELLTLAVSADPDTVLGGLDTAARAFHRLVSSGDAEPRWWWRRMLELIDDSRGLPGAAADMLEFAPSAWQFASWESDHRHEDDVDAALDATYEALPGWLEAYDWDGELKWAIDATCQTVRALSEEAGDYALYTRFRLGRWLVTTSRSQTDPGQFRPIIDQVGLAEAGLEGRGHSFLGEHEGPLGETRQLGWSDYDLHNGFIVDGFQVTWDDMVVLAGDRELSVWEYLSETGQTLICRRCGAILPAPNVECAWPRRRLRAPGHYPE
jgi:hypothetical protein